MKRGMFALILGFTLGWRFAVAELLAELALGVAFFAGGGGGSRLRRALLPLRTAPAPGRAGAF